MKRLWLPPFLLLLFSIPCPAQATKVVVTQADESKFPEINVYFELKNPDGTPVRNAAKGDFRVVEDGKERPILGFDAPVSVEQRATTVVLVVDRSGSMKDEGKMEGLREAVRTFLAGLPAGSRISVVAFGSDVRTACPFTEDYPRVQRAVDALEPDGATRFYDAVATAVRRLEGEPGRKAILALTDGEDTASRQADIGAAIDLARRANLPVHTLGLGREEQINGEALTELAEATRGQSYRAESAEQLRKIYEELAERLGSSYRIAYATDRPVKDGTLRPIQVFYSKSAEAGVAAVYIPGMVVRSPGWSGLFLLLFLTLAGLACLPRRSPKTVST